MNETLEKRLLKKSCLTKTPIKGNLELLPTCNMHCKMCYVYEEYSKAVLEMKPLDFWLSLIPEMKKAGVLFLTLIGGEPFLFEGLDLLYKELISNGFYVNLTTNGIMLADGIPEWLLELPPRYITVSMYGASDETYYKVTGMKDGFSKVMKAISNLQEANIPLKINCCAIPENKDDIIDIVRLANTWKVPVVAASYCFPNDSRRACENYQRLSAHDAADLFWKIKKEKNHDDYSDRVMYYAKELFVTESSKRTQHFYCNAGTCNFWIDWKGHLISCGVLNEPFVDLENKTFGDAWNELTKKCEHIISASTCVNCKYREICEACPANIKAETGQFDGLPKYICDITEKKVEIAKEIASKYEVVE